MFQNYLFLSTLFRLIPLGFIAFLAFPQPLSAQEFMRQGQRWMIGWQLGFFYVKAKEPYPSEQEYNLLLLESYLDIGYFVNKKLMLGSRAGLAFKASGNAMDFPDLYHLGYFSRYYPFEGDEGMNMEASFCEKCVTFRIRPYLQLSHIFTNSQIRQGKNIGLDHLGVQRVGAFAGFSTRLRNNLFFDLGAGVRYSSNSDESFFIENISSLEYFFGYSKKKENQNRPDCNATLAGSMFACKKEKKKEEGKEKQKKPRGIILGSSLTYITDRSFDGAEGKYKELSWNINATTFLSRRLRTGINTIQIFTSAPSEIKEKYFLIGGIGQYEPFLSKKHFFMLEAGLMYGNYCTCEAGDPTKRDGLYYVDLGGSFEMQLSKKLYLDIGFNVYNILNDVKGKYAYTQYILGLNYIIGKR